MVPTFEHLLEEDSVYIISNFEVVGDTGSIRLTNHSSKINFEEATTVQNCTEYKCPADGFEFAAFKDVLDRKIDINIAFDIIGQVISNKPLWVLKTFDGVTTQILECELQNLSGEKVQCALWNDHATKLQQFISINKDTDAPVIIVIQLAKFGIWNRQPQVSNCMFGSRLYINDDIAYITSFLNSLHANHEDEKTSQDVHLSSHTIYTQPEDYFKKFPLKNIDELIAIKKATRCVIVATIIKVQDDQGWNYLAC